MKNILRAMSFGISIGMVVYLIMLALYKVPGQSSLQIFSTVVFSAAMGWAALIYDKDNWSFLKQGIIHFLTIFVLVVGMTVLNGWLPWQVSLSSLVAFFLEFIVIYAVIWLVIYFSNRSRIRKINGQLKSKNEN